MSGLRWHAPKLLTVPGSEQKRLCLGRFRWEKEIRGKEVSHELTLSLYVEPRDLWVGLYWDHSEFERWVFYLCCVPCLPLRIKFARSHGGRFG